MDVTVLRKKPIIFFQKKKLPEFKKSSARAIPALMLPFIILGGIYGGIFTPTEAAAVAAFSALIIGFLIYRDLSFKQFIASVSAASETTGIMLIILLFSLVAGRVFTILRVPQEITSFMMLTFHEPWMVLLAVNFFLNHSRNDHG